MKHILLIFFVAFSGAFSFSQTVFVFDTPGITSFTVPAGCHTKITVQVYGAGGGGAGSSTNTIGGGGGGAGGFAQSIVTGNPGDIFAIQIGTGGAAGTNVSNGNTGSITRFNGGTLFATGGTGGKAQIAGGAGGNGGTASGWARNITGANGAAGTAVTGGNGGDCFGANGGIGGIGGLPAIAGNPGTNYGSGGGGGGRRFGPTTVGAAGTHGAIIITVGRVYKSIAPGAWNVAGNWDSNMAPPNIIKCGDSVIVNHAIILDDNKNVIGNLLVNSTGSLTGVTRTVEVGRTAINQGEFSNYGTISVKNLKSEPAGCLVYIDPYPVINNHAGGVINAVKIDIGKGCGSGRMYNFVGATINVSGELHIDGYLCNQDSIYVGVKTKIHGGLVECCGYIQTPIVEFGANEGRPGTSECQDFCTSLGTTPTLSVGGSGVTAVTIYDNANPAQGVVTGNDSTTFCAGILLPIELASFEGINQGDENLLSWVTNSEQNNDYFTIERSVNGFDWEYVESVNGAGTSIHSKYYELIDSDPFTPVTYYRLSQTDFDGYVNFFDVISVNRQKEVGGFISALFPNPAEDYATFIYNGSNPSGMLTVQFLNELGQVVMELEQKVYNGIATSIRTDDLTSGLYHVAFIQGDERSVQKLSIIK